MRPSDFIHPEDATALRPMEPPSSAHIPACYVSKLRSSLEFSKKWPRVWLQYACSVTEVLLYLSFSVFLVLLWSPYDSLKMVRSGFLDKPSGKAEREEGSKWYVKGNICSSVNEASFMASRTYVYKAIGPSSFSVLGVYKMPYEDSFHDKLK